MDISHFFERPILLSTTEWKDATSYFATFNLWASYFSHPTIWPKLLGFSRMTANLEVEIRINGSPFRFGEIMVSYRPLFSSDLNANLCNMSGGYIPEDGCVSTVVGFPSVNPSSNRLTLVARSQRMHTFLKVSSSTGSKMVLPFIYPYEAIRMTSLQYDPAVAAEVTNMKNTTFYKSLMGLGTLTMESLSPLVNTQTASTTGVTIDIFVRASNVRVWMASGTATFKPQGREEGKGVESVKPSVITSAIALGARAFTHIPVIGPWATAASMVADGVTSILQFFGFTPPPLVSNAMPVVVHSAFNECSLTKPRHLTNLGLDHNNQVSIDPSICGGDQRDELCFARFVERPTILGLCYFGANLNVDDSIFILPVHPMLGLSDNPATPTGVLPYLTRMQLTPAAFAAMNFRYWRGTCVVRLHAIKTQYHSGRLRITWEPEIAGSTSAATTNMLTVTEGYQQMAVWDLGGAEDMVFKIGFGARSGRLTVPPSLQNPAFSSLSTGASWAANTISSLALSNPSYISDNYLDYVNGFFRISVANRLQGPNVSDPIPIVVSCHFEDLQLYDPLESSLDAVTTNNLTYLSTTNYDTTGCYGGSNGVLSCISTRAILPETFYPQGMDATDVVHVFQPTTSSPPLVYEGEVVASLRSLAQRETYYDTLLYEIPQIWTTAKACAASKSVAPCIINTILPWRPSCFGTVGPHRSSTFTTDSTAPTVTISARDYYIGMQRTPLCVLLQECFVGQRGSYNWKFKSGPSFGTKIKEIYVSRSNNADPYLRSGSFPRGSSLNPLLGTYLPDATNLGFAYATEKRSTLSALAYDAGTNATWTGIADWNSSKGVRANVTAKLASLRFLLNSLMPTFASGAMSGYGEDTVGIRFPYASLMKFLPGSTTGWINPHSNGELASNLKVTIITSDNATASTSTLGATGVNAADGSGWRTVSGLPSRSFVSVNVCVSAGDDWSVANFVNVPALYMQAIPDGQINAPTQANA